MTPSREGWPTKAKEAPSAHELRLTPLDTNPGNQHYILQPNNIIQINKFKKTILKVVGWV